MYRERFEFSKEKTRSEKEGTTKAETATDGKDGADLSPCRVKSET